MSLLSGQALTHTIAGLRSIGVQFSRENFDWNIIEPQPGQFDWQTTDSLVSAAAKQGLQIIPILWSSPSWVESGWNVPPSSSSATARYAAFVQMVVARYGSRGTFWTANPSIPRTPVTYYDVWNEPYNRCQDRSKSGPLAPVEKCPTGV